MGIRIGSKEVGPGHPCFVIAEAGINHNGSLELAHRLVDATANAGADAIKFQNYETADFAGPNEPLHKVFERCELPKHAFPELQQHAHERGLAFICTPTSVAGVQRLTEMGVDALKNGSDYLQRHDVIQAMAKSGLPTILSCGMAYGEEIAHALVIYRSCSGSDVVLLHCVSSYPTVEGHNLRKIPALASWFLAPVGFSDHSAGIDAALVAVAKGACVIEKHFTLDKGAAGPDHSFSADPAEMAEMAKRIHEAEGMLGDPRLEPAECEMELRVQYRVSCVAAGPLEAGQTIEPGDIVFCRPGCGLPPIYASFLAGRELKVDVGAGEVFTPEHFA